MRSQEIPHDLIVALAVHPLLHGFVSLYAETPTIDAPGPAVDRIGIDDHPIHIENDRQPRTQPGPYPIIRFLLAIHGFQLPASSGNWVLHRQSARRQSPALRRNAAVPAQLA